jgi:hypothetical protein
MNQATLFYLIGAQWFSVVLELTGTGATFPIARMVLACAGSWLGGPVVVQRWPETRSVGSLPWPQTRWPA